MSTLEGPCALWTVGEEGQRNYVCFLPTSGWLYRTLPLLGSILFKFFLGTFAVQVELNHMEHYWSKSDSFPQSLTLFQKRSVNRRNKPIKIIPPQKKLILLSCANIIIIFKANQEVPFNRHSHRADVSLLFLR